MHALSLQASQVADIFHFCAYKVIIIILMGVTEQGSIHCHCQPPINIPLLQGNPRSSRDLQFTQLRSMWTKPSILSLSLFFLPPLSPILALHFPITAPTRSATVYPLHFSDFLPQLSVSPFQIFFSFFNWFTVSGWAEFTVIFWLHTQNYKHIQPTSGLKETEKNISIFIGRQRHILQSTYQL